MIYGVQQFHQYFYGRRFTLVTDHRPLTMILSPTKGVPPLAAARMQRWALRLSAYTYDVEFRSSREHGNADGLSRLPLDNQEQPATSSVFTIGQIQALPVTAERIEATTRQDPILSRVHRYVRQGWPTSASEAVKPYWNRRLELSTEGGCLLWGDRLIVPQKLRSRIVEELHQDHPGVVRMKAVARSYLWWPGLDRELEECAKSCISCRVVKSSPARAPLHPWLWPAKPWQRVHVDFAGPFMGKTFLIVVDAHSKWAEVIEMPSTTAGRTIMDFRRLFAAYGLPEQLVIDNGPQFISQEFSLFMRMNGVKHIGCTPYHPSSNGAAERFVQTFKNGIKTGSHSLIPLHHRWPTLSRRIAAPLMPRPVSSLVNFS